MKKDKITREDITATLVTALKPLNYFYALWEGGSASFDRVDQWSDIDLYLVVEDEKVEDSLSSIEQSFLNLSEIDLKFRLPEPTWHGHSQVFYRLKKTSPFLFLDIVVIKKSSKDKFLQFRIHGKPVVYFDKIAVVKDDPIDPEYFLNKIQSRLEMLKTNFDLFQVLILKELNRSNEIEALSYYLSYTYRPLVEVLRIKYCPYHHNFHNSYIYYDLPPEVVKRLHKLNFIANSKELRQFQVEAEAWFWEVVKSINPDDLKRKISDQNL
jgi:hypothetical protein